MTQRPPLPASNTCGAAGPLMRRIEPPCIGAAPLSPDDVDSINTGRAMDPERWRARKAHNAVLVEQTEALAAKLEAEGIPAFAAGNVIALGLVTGESEPVNRYRAIRFLPAVAQRDRRPILNELRYFRRHNHQHNRYMRLAVVTNGPRVPVPRRGDMGPDLSDKSSILSWELRERIQALHRSCSKFAYWARHEFGIDVVLIAIEFTVKCEPDDTWSVHPHANLLYTPPVGGLPRGAFQRFLREAPQHFGGYWWKDCSRLHKPEEAIKYPFKPAELDELDSAAVAWLYHQLSGLKLATPIGSFRKWRNAELCEYGTCSEPGAKRRARKVMTVYRSEGPRFEVVNVRRRGARKPKDDEGTSAASENMLLGATSPQHRHSPYAEPCALISNYTASPRFQACRGPTSWDRLQFELEPLRARARANWDQNGAPDPETALAIGRGQAAAREGEAGKLVPLSFTPVAQLSSEHGCEKPARAPPTEAELRLLAVSARQRAYPHLTGEEHPPAGAYDDAIPARP